MTRTLITTVLALFFTLTATAQDSFHRGPGCWRTRTARQQAAARLATPRKTDGTSNYQGKKKGLVILATFTDKTFKEEHNQEKYNDILNAHGYTTDEGFRGSVADYFRDQSGGLFELDFDVVGPYVTKNDYAYYGKNDAKGNDLHPEEMVIEVCEAADSVVNFADYDWDGDGVVDEVFVLYAGKGEADGGGRNTIWPHMWTLEEAGKQLTLDSVRINVYACANELMANGKINGIGTFCHEFSHCLGLPDFYDINYSGSYGMGNFDVMDGGLYLDNGFCPVGYSAYEKMACGWQQPIVLSSEDVTVDNLKPMNQQGDFYIIYNDAHSDEYYLIENRQKEGWDSYFPSKGLMISHVDYDEDVWIGNIPNTIMTDAEAIEMGLICGNNHQRMTFFHANNSERWPALYPYEACDSLTATSTPAATLFHDNSLGSKLMMASVLNIRQNDDGTMGFTYRAVNPIVVGIRTPNTQHPIPADAPTRSLSRSLSPNTIYSLDGRVAGTSLESLQKGIYIKNNRKIVIR